MWPAFLSMAITGNVRSARCCAWAILATWFGPIASIIVCPPGKYGPLQFGCAACDKGQYSDVPGMRACSLCPGGKYSDGGSAASGGATKCSPCIKGRFSESSSVGCLPCPRGKYAASSGARQCGDCKLGKFADFTPSGTTGCNPCPPGRYADRKGLLYCKLCRAGRFGIGGVAGLGLGFSKTKECSGRCSPGTFAGAGAGRCKTCPAGRHQPAHGASGCLPCLAGRFAAAHKVLRYKHKVLAPIPHCAACPSGKWSSFPGDAVKCKLCAAGRHGVAGANSSACGGPCAVGRHSSAGAYACLPCVTGRYQYKLGQTTCLFCRPGRSSAKVGSARCKNCPAGRYTVATASRLCDACPAGHFGKPGAAHAECAGRCGPGKFSAQGASKCSKCVPGTFTVAHGMANCTACPAGKHGLADGEHCKPCEPGRYVAAKGFARCVPCPAGTYGLGGDSTARCHSRCRAGSFSKAGAYRCEYCAKGQYQATMGKSGCSVCPTGKYSAPAPHVPTAECTSCAPGRFGPAKGATACQLCSLGRFSENGGGRTCDTKCPAGKYANRKGASACRPCAVGMYQRAAGATRCLACPAGQLSASDDGGAVPAGGAGGASHCSGCAPGRYSGSNEAAHCASCNAGRYGSGGSTKPSCSGACPAGRFSRSGAASCYLCPAGKFQAAAGQSYCLPCDVGRATAQHLAVPTRCDSCPAGRFANATGTVACSPCAAGHFGRGPGATASVCSGPCAAGRFSHPGATACLACLPGYYTTMFGQKACVGCPLGKFSAAATASPKAGSAAAVTSCTLCPGGQFIEYSGGHACKKCPPGWFSNAGAKTCTICPPGHFGGSGASSRRCDGSCPAGTYSKPGSSKCMPCAPGRFGRAGASSATCSGACAAGRFAGGGAAACSACAAGRYQAHPASSSCHLCPVGKYAAFNTDVGTAQCSPCAGGRFGNTTGAGACLPCVPGHYGGGAGFPHLHLSCLTKCPAGKYSRAGAAWCTSCERGRYAERDGRGGDCAPCAAGQYAPYVYSGTTSCKPCGAGRYSLAAAPACTSCHAGRYQAAKGWSSCEACPAGKYAPAVYSGTKACYVCPTGRTSKHASAACGDAVPTPKPLPRTTKVPQATLAPHTFARDKHGVCQTVSVVGFVSSGSAAAQCVGVYVRRPLLRLSDRPVYKFRGGATHSKCSGSMMFYAQQVGMWVVGRTLGSPPYLLAVRSVAAAPENITGVWAVAGGGGAAAAFHPVQQLRIVCGALTLSPTPVRFVPMPTPVPVTTPTPPPTALTWGRATAKDGAKTTKRKTLVQAPANSPTPTRLHRHASKSASTHIIRGKAHVHSPLDNPFVSSPGLKSSAAKPSAGAIATAAAPPPQLRMWAAVAVALACGIVAVLLVARARSGAAKGDRSGAAGGPDSANGGWRAPRGGYQSVGGMELTPAAPYTVATTQQTRMRGPGDVYEAEFDTWRKVGLRLSSSAQVTEIATGGQAARAGIRVHDIIVAVNGQSTLERHPPFWRKGQGTIVVQIKCGSGWNAERFRC